MRYRWIGYRYTEVVGERGTSLFEDLWTARLPSLLSQPQWRPAVDLYETPENLIVKAEIAGLSDDDFEITLYDDALVIEGVRPWRLTEKAARFHAAEVRYGPFHLEVPITTAVDRERVRAKYDAGFLSIWLPKLEVETS